MISLAEVIRKHKLPEKPDGKMMDYAAAKKYFGDTLMGAVVKHPYFIKYIRDASHGKQVAFRHSVSSGGYTHYIDITHADPGNGIRNWVKFAVKMSGRTVTDPEVFRNKDGERNRDGKLHWTYLTNPKMDKEDTKRSKKFANMR